MPIAQIEEIKNRSDEKIALFLTAENGRGLLAGALPTYVLSQALPFLVRVLLILVAAGLGVALTVRVGGLALYERSFWRVRGWLRRRLRGGRITPEQLVGARSVVQADRALLVRGPIAPVVRHRQQQVATAQRPLRKRVVIAEAEPTREEGAAC